MSAARKRGGKKAVVYYRIERKNDVRTRGSSSKPTESERSFTIEAVGGRGSAAGADENFRAWLAANAPTDAFGNPIAVGGVAVFKPGRAYLWTLTEKSFDSKRNVVVPVVRAVYVEQTYRAADFGALARLVSILG